MTDTYTVVENIDKSQFEVQLGSDLALAQYRLRGDAIILTHTEVPSAFEGKGVGSALAKAALDHAREEGLTVVPLCPFIASYIKRHPEYADLVK